MGDTISGFFNTSTAGLLTAAFDSGVGKFGEMLSGFFFWPAAGRNRASRGSAHRQRRRCADLYERIAISGRPRFELLAYP